jgi:hypothetical protein
LFVAHLDPVARQILAKAIDGFGATEVQLSGEGPKGNVVAVGRRR